MELLSLIKFINPYFLWLIPLLPILWFLFRAVPPKPRALRLSTARFLDDIHTDNTSTAQTPWWLRILRIFLFLGIILAASTPYISHEDSDVDFKKEAIAIIYDNSWASTSIQNEQKNIARSLIQKAMLHDRNIIWINTARPSKAHDYISYLAPSEAMAYLDDLRHYPWKSNHNILLSDLNEKETQIKKADHFYWLGHGYNDNDIYSIVNYLNNFGTLHYYSPTAQQRSKVIRPALNSDISNHYNIFRFDGFYQLTENSENLYIKNNFGQSLNFISLTDIKNNNDIDISKLWETLQKDEGAKPAYLQLSAQKNAGSVYYTPEQVINRHVGILARAKDIDSDVSPLMQSIYYLGKAVESKTSYTIGTVDELLQHSPNLIIIPETYSVSSNDITRLDTWVRQGGTLLRFPTNNRIHTVQDTLYPSKMISEPRNIAGRLDWQDALTLGDIPKESPLYGLSLETDLSVNKHILPEDNLDKSYKTWATFSDNTPLITAKPIESGQIIYVHTQITPAWSNMAITGFFVNFIHRVIDKSSGAFIPINTHSDKDKNQDIIFTPYKVINSHGTLATPPDGLKAITYKDYKNKPLSHDLWPGIYRTDNAEIIINLGDKIGPLTLIKDSQLKAKLHVYDAHKANITLTHYLLILILVLFFIEWLSMSILTGLRPLKLKQNKQLTISIAITLISLVTLSTNVQAANQAEAQKANALNLAYIKTNNLITDSMSDKALNKVANALMTRTAISNIAVSAVDIHSDELAFYPLLYWPLTNEKLSVESYRNINDYIARGGMLFIDLRNGDKLNNSFYTQNSAIRELGNNLTIPIISPLPANHVLRRSYYLLEKGNLHARYKTGDIWLDLDPDLSEKSENELSQYVASFIVGSNDWIGLLADNNADIYEQEIALRFMMNLVMYALTGTYKSDQVHTKAILERLEQRQRRAR